MDTIEITLPELTAEQERRLWQRWTGLWFRQEEDHWMRGEGRWRMQRSEAKTPDPAHLEQVARQLLQAVFCVDVSLGFQARLRWWPASGTQATTLTYRDLPGWHQDCDGCDDPLCGVPDGIPLAAERVRAFLKHTRERGSHGLAQLAQTLLQREEVLGSPRALVLEAVRLLGEKEQQFALTMPHTPERVALEDECALLRHWLTLARRVEFPLPLVGEAPVEVGSRLLRLLAAQTWATLQSYRLSCWHIRPHEAWVCEACEAVRALRQSIGSQLRLPRQLFVECLRLQALVPLPYYEQQVEAALDLLAWADAHLQAWVMPPVEHAVSTGEAPLAQWAAQHITSCWQRTWSAYGLPPQQPSVLADRVQRLAVRYARMFRHTLSELERLAPREALRCTSPTLAPLDGLLNGVAVPAQPAALLLAGQPGPARL